MHTLNRTMLVLALFAGLLPLAATHALLVSTGERYQKQEELHRALTEASEYYRTNAGLRSTQERSRRVLEEAEEELPALARRKREVRMQLASVQAVLAEYRSRGIDPAEEARMRALVEGGEKELASFVRLLASRDLLAGEPGGGALLLETMFGESLGERTEAAVRGRAMLRARARLLGMAATAGQYRELETAYRAEYEELSAEYLGLLADSERADRSLHASAGREAEIRRIVAEVHDEILRMQSELARIDARLRRRAERELIEKGLLPSREGSYNDGTVVGPADALSWPVFGPVSAGFMNASYKEYFGVEHRGTDIVVPQGTAVRSAADGIVFLARDGGATGYSYILIGHRGGTATLYGHVSQILVATGQEVERGEAIALSGGEPGTHGAGPMTTGSHLHFEVVQNGAHVDPLRVLPAR